MVLRYLDSGVYITAWRTKDESNSKSRRLFEDPANILVASRFVVLETLAKASYHRRMEEVAFYEALFSLVERWVPNDAPLLERAIEIGATYDITNLDAIHIAAAERAAVHEFVTTEKPDKPIFRAAMVGPRFLSDLPG